MDTGLTTIDEKDIDKHRPTAQSMVTRVIVLEASTGLANTALAGTGRRFVSTVSTGGTQRTKEIELAKTVAAVRPTTDALDPAAHPPVPGAARAVCGPGGRRCLCPRQ